MNPSITVYTHTYTHKHILLHVILCIVVYVYLNKIHTLYTYRLMHFMDTDLEAHAPVMHTHI